MRILIVLIITFLFYNQLYSDDVKIEYKNPDNVFTNFFSFKINSNVKFLLKEIQFRNNNKSEKRYKYNKYLNNNLFKISLAELSSGFYQIWIIGETNNHYYRKEFEVLLLNVKQKQNSENNTAEICYELFIKNKFDMQHYKYNKFSNWVDNFLLSAVKNQYHHPVINMVLTDYFYANNNYTHSIKKFNETIYYLLKYNKYKKDKILRKLMDLKQKKYFYKKVSEKSYIREWIKAKIIIFFTLNNISTFNKTKQFKLAMSEFFKTTEYIFTIHSLCINFKSIIMEAPTQSFIISTIINNYSGLIVENIKENKINNAIKILNVIMNIINIVNDNKIKIPMFELRKEAFYSWRAYLEYLRRNEKKMRKYLEIGEKKTKINYFLQAHLYYDRGKYDDSVKYLKKCLVPDAFVLSSPLNPKIRFFYRGEIYNMMGMCYFKKGYYQIALDKFLSAVSSSDALPVYKENLAICYQKLGEKEKALEILDELSSLPNLFLKVYMNSLKYKVKYKVIEGVPSVWVLPFNDVDGVVKRAGIGEYLQDVIMDELYKTKKFRIVARDKIKEIIKEKKLSLSRFGDKKYVKDKKKIISADYIISGNYTETKQGYKLSIKMVSVKTGEVIKMKLYKIKRFDELLKKIREFIIS